MMVKGPRGGVSKTTAIDIHTCNTKVSKKGNVVFGGDGRIK